MWNRAQLNNQLRSHLKQYCPAALAAFAVRGVGLDSREARAVLAGAPAPHTAARLTRAQLRAAQRRSGRDPRSTDRRDTRRDRGSYLSCAPGPWHVRQLDDAFTVSLVAISTVPDTGAGERWPDSDHRQIVAATLVQQLRHVDVADEHRDENADFIANARQDVPRLIAEIRRLGRLLESQDQKPRAG